MTLKSSHIERTVDWVGNSACHTAHYPCQSYQKTTAGGDLAVDFSEETAIISIGTMIVFLVFVAALLTVFFLLFRQQAKSIWSSTVMVFNRPSHHETAPPSLMAEEIIKEDDDGLEVLQCVVCLCQLYEGEKYRLLPKCRHKFHVHCIDAWLKGGHSTCPLCRSTVPHTYLPNSQDTYQQQQQHFFYGADLLYCCFISFFENLCRWLVNPLNPELMSALCEQCQYLPS
ncbi:unnamed protein product [Ilex paraguariensis]|uniref:RING-type domain-containing protein n=1 Tax=Ilex paraguariensis TaxID=185542 RepID=A0ABC8RJX9_9AQUA